jgi:Tfp pilus tip-associated adhesin PilY1
MAVDALSGGQPANNVFDLNNDGVFDPAIGGIQIGAALGGTTFIKGQAGSSVGLGVSSLTTGVLDTKAVDFGSASGGRINWREILR